MSNIGKTDDQWERPRPKTRDEFQRLIDGHRQIQKAIAQMRRGQVIWFSAEIARMLAPLVRAEQAMSLLIDEARPEFEGGA